MFVATTAASVLMETVMQGEACEETVPMGPIHGAFGSVQGGPDVSNEVMAATSVESLGGSSSPKWEIAGILSHDDHG